MNIRNGIPDITAASHLLDVALADHKAIVAGPWRSLIKSEILIKLIPAVRSVCRPASLHLTLRDAIFCGLLSILGYLLGHQLHNGSYKVTVPLVIAVPNVLLDEGLALQPPDQALGLILAKCTLAKAKDPATVLRLQSSGISVGLQDWLNVWAQNPSCLGTIIAFRVPLTISEVF